MPFGNGRGPSGMGPMTGRAAGFCAGYSLPGYANPIPGRGFWGSGFGRGGGRGHRRWFHATGLTGWQRTAYGYPYAMPYGAYDDPYPAPYSRQPGYSNEDHLNDLKQHARQLEGMLEDIRKQIDNMKTSAEAE
jgi:hypothetical protein